MQFIVIIMGAQGGTKDVFLAEMKKIPACRKSPEQLAMNMQKAILLGYLCLLRQMSLAEGH